MAYSGSMTDRELVTRIARAPGKKAGYKQLIRELNLGGGLGRRLLREQLARLTARGTLVKLDREHWALPTTAEGKPGGANLIAGRLDLHRDGYGFVRPNARLNVNGKPAEDVFVPPDAINGAMQGDQVLVDCGPARADGRRQGRIVRVLTRRNPTVVGTFRLARSNRDPGHQVLPFDERMTQPIVIPFDQALPPQVEEKNRVLGKEAATARPVITSEEDLDGLVVDVEITRWPTPMRPAQGKVIEVLGDAEEFGVDVEMMIRKHQLPRVFPAHVLEEARTVARLDPDEIARRRDFRALPIVTIDGETAKDFDDAVLVDEHEDGSWSLQVHIADVSEYVREGSDLDFEARLRGTSVYFPDRAIPMLPQELSTDICSLRPSEDRLTLSCLMELDAKGRLTGYEVVEGVIRSAARMTYTEVHAILEGDAATRTRYSALVPGFERMKRLAVRMNQRRQERGSIDFDLPEPVIQFDAAGNMSGVVASERTWSNRLIEEFMLAANECVASWLEDLGVPSLYRIHERPEPRRVVEFEDLAASFGVSLGLGPLPVKRVQTRGDRRDAQRRGGRPARTYEVPEEIAVTPRMYQKLAQRIEGTAEERILSYLMLRSLKQARYSEKNEGHFALAAPTYTHFTSPIRRYPDLIVHRIAKTLLRAGTSGVGELEKNRLASPWTHPNEGLHGIVVDRRRFTGEHFEGTPPIGEEELAAIAEEASLAERRAAEAERELVEWKKVRFMRDRVGEEFDALVLNPSKYGLFVELTAMFVDGLVPLDSMRDDRYHWQENTHEIVGQRWGRRFQAGDRVEVVLERILAQERKLQFALVEEELKLTGKKMPKARPHAKKKKGTSAPSRSFSARKKFTKKGERRRPS